AGRGAAGRGPREAHGARLRRRLLLEHALRHAGGLRAGHRPRGRARAQAARQPRGLRLRRPRRAAPARDPRPPPPPPGPRPGPPPGPGAPGRIAPAMPAGGDGPLQPVTGQWPADAATLAAVKAALPDGLDLFLSKNTLKRGYIHPERETDPRRLVHLGVDDAAFVAAVAQALKPGGLFVIYNLRSEEHTSELQSLT